jgi:hypothetical protein
MLRDAYAWLRADLAADIEDLEAAWGPRFVAKRAAEVILTPAIVFRTTGHVLVHGVRHPDSELSDERVCYGLEPPLSTATPGVEAVRTALWAAFGSFLLVWWMQRAGQGFAWSRLPTLLQWWAFSNAALLFGDPVWTGLWKIKEMRHNS